MGFFDRENWDVKKAFKKAKYAVNEATGVNAASRARNQAAADAKTERAAAEQKMEERDTRNEDLIAQAMANRAASGEDQWRAQQQQLAQSLQAQASGQGGPSLAEVQLRQGQDQAMAQARAIAASQPGMSPGAALRMSLNAQGGMSMQANAQAAQMRAAEQMQARQSLGSVLAGGRGQDISGQQLNDAYQVGMLGNQMGIGQDLAGLYAGYSNQANQNNLTMQQMGAQQAQRRGDMVLGAGLTAAGTYVGNKMSQ